MRVILSVLILSLALFACGRKGDLQPPPGTTAAPEKPAKTRGLF